MPSVGRMHLMTNLEHRVRGLQTRLTELSGEQDEKWDQLSAEISELRKDVKAILDLLKKREGN